MAVRLLKMQTDCYATLLQALERVTAAAREGIRQRRAWVLLLGGVVAERMRNAVSRAD